MDVLGINVFCLTSTARLNYFCLQKLMFSPLLHYFMIGHFVASFSLHCCSFVKLFSKQWLNEATSLIIVQQTWLYFYVLLGLHNFFFRIFSGQMLNSVLHCEVNKLLFLFVFIAEADDVYEMITFCFCSFWCVFKDEFSFFLFFFNTILQLLRYNCLIGWCNIVLNVYLDWLMYCHKNYLKKKPYEKASFEFDVPAIP